MQMHPTGVVELGSGKDPNWWPLVRTVPGVLAGE